MDDIEQVRVYIDKVKKDLKLSEDSSILAEYEIADVKMLSGGLMNYVYRVYFHHSNHTSITVILKYFPPFLAMDKSIPFSQDRFTVEKSALEWLTSSPWLSTNRNSIARTPKLFFSDKDNFVIIMEDVGERAQLLTDLLKHNSDLEVKVVKQLAHEIKFFIDYIIGNGHVTLENHPEFENKSFNDFAKAYLIQVWPEQAKITGLETELSDYLTQGEIFYNPPDFDKDSAVLTFGDLWPNSIMIDLEAADGIVFWFIDWEATRFHRDPFRDMEQFMCTLWLMKQNEVVYNTIKVGLLIQELQLVQFGNADQDWRSMGRERKIKFILWLLCLFNEDHWCIENKREVLLRALDEVKDF
jgi:hypothetical protein